MWMDSVFNVFDLDICICQCLRETNLRLTNFFLPHQSNGSCFGLGEMGQVSTPINLSISHIEQSKDYQNWLCRHALSHLQSRAAEHFFSMWIYLQIIFTITFLVYRIFLKKWKMLITKVSSKVMKKSSKSSHLRSRNKQMLDIIKTIWN